MNIEIKRLTPELTEDYLHFFDVTPHDDDLPGSKCYCVCWCSADSKNEDFSSEEKRRNIAIKYVRDHKIQGYLAYHNNQVVGWCNANNKSDCFKCISWKTFMKPIHKDRLFQNKKMKSIFCFVISPEMRGKGIASLLVKRICEDAKADGFDFVEVYPNKEFVNTSRDFMGPNRMYEKQGFAVYYKTKEKIVMRKALK